MANRLKMAKVNIIKTLGRQGWSRRRIAEALELDPRTVGRYLDTDVSKCAEAPTGSETPSGTSKCTKAPTGSPSLDEAGIPAAEPTNQSSRSDCEPYRPIIVEKLSIGLSAVRIYQDLTTEHGFGGSYWSVRRFVRGISAKTPMPFRRMECEPGAEVQVDFGAGAPIVTPDGKRRRTHVFRVVLSHSRKGYSEAVFRQTTDNFLAALENAFRYFGGSTETVVIDNLKAAVAKADWYDPELHPKIQSLAAHYHTVVLPTKAYTPRHKGKIERGIDYVQENGLKGRTFQSLEEENAFLLQWEQTVADTRIHGTTKQQVGRLFEKVEKSALKPLPNDRFPMFREAQRSVNRDGHVEVDKAYYSAPPEYLGRRVWVRWDSRLVRLFNHRFEQIAVHVKHAPGRFSTLGEHLKKEKISGIECGADRLLLRVRSIGPHAGAWASEMLENRGIEGIRVLMGLIQLANQRPSEAIDRACQTALSYGAYRLRTIRELIKRAEPHDRQRTFLEEHPIIRSLGDYGDVVARAMAKSRGAP